MTTQQIIRAYFKALSTRGDWQAFFADGMVFVSHAAPGKRVAGKQACIESTRGFYSMIQGIDVQELFCDGERACVLTRYRLEPPRGESFTSDVAEVFTVKAGKIDSFQIYFDSAPYPTPAGP